MKVTLGGDRLGSGNKNKIALRNYERSTHNLSQRWTSSMQVGTLYPFLCIPAMRGDKFDISIDADARTVPTKGPLFGSFKMQVDLFQCDVRLYQAILHNNPLAIGLNMNRVMFPQLQLRAKSRPKAFSNSCLLKYLGMSGICGQSQQTAGVSIRRINAIPALAYYEIFKTYYANKQEENAYLIGTETQTGNLTEFNFNVNGQTYQWGQNISTINAVYPINIQINTNNNPEAGFEKDVYVVYYNDDEDEIGRISLDELRDRIYTGRETHWDYTKGDPTKWKLYGQPENTYYICFVYTEGVTTYTQEVRGLQEFPLKNIDNMRLALLSDHTLGSAFQINNGTGTPQIGEWNKDSGETDSNGLPYTTLVDWITERGDSYNINPLNGLVVKTYQSDIYNNWVNTEWIDGENGISAVTAISTSDGSIKVDTINLAEKLYNMLNRIAVSDGSYEGWQDAVYTDTPRKHIESPIYLGGMSSEIVFEEIVQTAPADGDPLGTLGGKGKLLKRKGGHVTIKCSEACFIIGIVSLTPRINYCQGNEFYLTDLLTMDDYHKPALDGIGFQNIVGERLAWWDTKLSVEGIPQRHIVGKVPAWMDYMTAVDKCFGDFAETEGRGFMTLLRDYGRQGYTDIKDATTYIDPRKFNYAFAVSDIDAQNFWVQIYSNIEARRLMSAKQIPNI